MNHSPQIMTVAELYDRNGRLKLVVDGDTQRIPTDYKIEATVKNSDGSIAEKKEMQFKSFVVNFAHYLNKVVYGLTTNSSLIYTTAGANPSSNITTLDALATTATDTYGIQVGLNNNASGSIPQIGTTTAYGDYALKNKIAHGTGTNQLSYGATTAATYNFGDTSFSLKRTFVNDSLASIQVAETGLVIRDNSTDYVLICRDVVDYNGDDFLIQVAVGQTLEITYVFSIASLYNYTGTAVNQILTQNWLSILNSEMTQAAKTALSTTNASASVAFHTNDPYKSAEAAAAETTYGILLGQNPTGFTHLLGGSIPSQKTTLTHSGHTRTDAMPSVIQLNLPNMHGVSGYNYANCLRIGSQRDFKNETAASITTNAAFLVVAGSGASARYLIGGSKFTSVTVGVLETLRVKMYLAFPISYSFTGN